MRNLTKQEREILQLHKLWLRGEEGGERADLSSADLRSADLRFADLRFANLSYADLRYADLRFANLSSADLRYADLRFANLRSADLRFADLRFANLRFANLLNTGAIAAQVGPFWCVCTPEELLIGCQRKTHKEWEAMTQEQAGHLMQNVEEFWAYRPLLLEMMSQCRVLGWPEGVVKENLQSNRGR